ncbi:MAG TPA: glycosyl hydrolase family 18 protein [Ktedonobacterales bacterium]
MAKITDEGVTQPLPPSLTPRPVRARRTRRRVARGALVTFILVAVLLAGSGAYAYFRLTATVTNFAGPHFNSNSNAVWLEHAWSGEPQSAAAYDALAAQLQREQIRYVYAHVGPLASDGTIPPSLAPYAADLAAALHDRIPDVKVLAWIGQLEAASGAPADETVDLAQSAVRGAIVGTADDFVRKYGFDGVHYDIEPIRNNNPHFLDLLIETRSSLPAGALISVSAQKWAPNAHLADLLYRAGRGGQWWTSYYFAAVAAHVDQLAVMTYDSGAPTAQAYEIFVQQETKHILAAVRTARRPPEVLIGVPTYNGDNAWFHQSAENMRTGLLGVIAGLNSDDETQPFAGVAIYRMAVTSDADWRTYDELWLGESTQARA